MTKRILLKDGSIDEAYKLFDEVRNAIDDFKKESVGISGNLRNKERGWTVVKVYL